MVPNGYRIRKVKYDHAEWFYPERRKFFLFWEPVVRDWHLFGEAKSFYSINTAIEAIQDDLKRVEQDFIYE